MGFKAETTDTPWAHGGTELHHAQAAIQGDNVDWDPHPTGMYARRGCDPETTSDGERAFSHQPQEAGEGGVSYRYPVSDSGSLGLIPNEYGFDLWMKELRGSWLCDGRRLHPAQRGREHRRRYG